jgi:hypothetical protein
LLYKTLERSCTTSSYPPHSTPATPLKLPQPSQGIVDQLQIYGSSVRTGVSVQRVR